MQHKKIQIDPSHLKSSMPVPRLQGASPAVQGAMGEEHGIYGEAPAAAPELLLMPEREQQAVRSPERAAAEETSTPWRRSPPPACA
jgi:hypothetical protein